MKSVIVAKADYAANHRAAIARGDVPAGTPEPNVVYHEGIKLTCGRKSCGQVFLASYPEVQRTVQCPHCNETVQTDRTTHGTP